MPPGRKPTPTALRVLRGNPSHRPLPADEPEHPPLQADDVPPEITAAGDAALREWNRIAPGLSVRGHVTTADRGLLIAYCVAYGQWVELVAQLRGDGKTPPAYTVKGAQGGQVANPLVGLANRTLDHVIRAASELGLTPTARTRVSKQPPPPPVSKWGKDLKR